MSPLPSDNQKPTPEIRFMLLPNTSSPCNPASMKIMEAMRMIAMTVGGTTPTTMRCKIILGPRAKGMETTRLMPTVEPKTTMKMPKDMSQRRMI